MEFECLDYATTHHYILRIKFALSNYKDFLIRLIDIREFLICVQLLNQTICISKYLPKSSATTTKMLGGV